MSRLDIDIIERLRYQKRYTVGIVTVTMEDAAKEIERLRLALDEACQIALGTELHRQAAERIQELLAAPRSDGTGQ